MFSNHYLYDVIKVAKIRKLSKRCWLFKSKTYHVCTAITNLSLSRFLIYRWTQLFIKVIFCNTNISLLLSINILTWVQLQEIIFIQLSLALSSNLDSSAVLIYLSSYGLRIIYPSSTATANISRVTTINYSVELALYIGELGDTVWYAINGVYNSPKEGQM